MYNLVQFGASERVSRVNWCIIWFSSGLQSANHLSKFGTSERRAHLYVCIYIYIYIVYEMSKGSNMFTKTCLKIYLDKEMFCQYIVFRFV